MEATKAEDAPNNDNQTGGMDPERQQFLENALKALTIDVIEQIQKAAEILGSETSSEVRKADAMDTILSYVDDIDTANDFCKIGGLFVLLPCLSSPYSTIRKKAALLIAELTQNNPNCQEHLLNADVLPKLSELLSEHETSVEALRAISCLIRNYEPGSKAFIEFGGIECLLGCLQQSQQEKLITRAAFLLNSLCADIPETKHDLIKLNVFKIITPLIQPTTEYNDCLETLLSLLCCLTEQPETVKQYLEGGNNLAVILAEIVKLGNDKPECKEIVEYSQTLLENLFKPNQEPGTKDR